MEYAKSLQKGSGNGVVVVDADELLSESFDIQKVIHMTQG